MSGTRRNGQLLNESSMLSSSSSLSNGGFRDASKHNCWHQCWAWAKDGFTIIACCFAILTAAITIALAFQIRFGTPQVPPAGAVASDDGECSNDAGLGMLRQGGSAVDAAVAALLCLSVTHPHLVGPGGGGVMLVHDHVQNRTRVIDFLPDIPASFDPARRTSFIGGESVGVPGFLHGLQRAHERYGKLPWETLFQPAIATARRGFSVSASLEDALIPLNSALIPSPPLLFPGRENTGKTSSSGTSNSFSATFVPFGVRLKRGTTVFRRPYAQLLHKVAKFGPKVVFELDYAVEVVEMLKESGSSISVAELHGYQVREYEAVWASYSNKTVFTTPGAGDLLLAVLQLLANTGVDNMTPPQELYEHVVQALKLTQPVYFKMAQELEQRAGLRAAFRSVGEELNLHDVYQDFSEKSRQLFDAEHESLQQQALITTPEFSESPSYCPIPCGLFSPCSVDIGRSFGGVVPKFELVQHK
ncbi:Gamma-glutamyltranspeptidase [Trinorchestia longiramus]|nr:Gamma-glutamyltranspeptidase [Trinorchestia longiramus]